MYTFSSSVFVFFVRLVYDEVSYFEFHLQNVCS
jgi:hypothetical protein